MFNSVDRNYEWALRLHYCKSGDELPFYEHAFLLVDEMFARFAPNDYTNFRNALSSIFERECGGMSEEELRNALFESFADE